MGKSGEFLTFDEVLKRLTIDEPKLKRLVSEGEIRALREKQDDPAKPGQKIDVMKFRKADVENLDLTGVRSEEETGVIDLSAGKKGDSEDASDDLIFGEGDDLDLSSAEPRMATVEISRQDTFVDEVPAAARQPDALAVQEVFRRGRPAAPAADDRTEVSEQPESDEVVEQQPRTSWPLRIVFAVLVILLGFAVLNFIRASRQPHATPAPAEKPHPVIFFKK